MIRQTKAMVVVSFGTTLASARKTCIESIERDMRQSFPQYDHYRVFTSQFVRRRLASEGIEAPSLEEVLKQLQQDGYQEVLVQVTHVTAGQEFSDKVIAVLERCKGMFATLRIGRPLLERPEDYTALVAALQEQIENLAQGQALLLMGHGSPNRENPAYERLQQEFDKGSEQVVVGALEENCHPNLDDAIKLLLQRRVCKVKLLPLLLVCGDHVLRDMLGAQAESWLNQLRTAGFEVEFEKTGLGERVAVRNLYIQHARDALTEAE
ncbi:sirohydrochlorin cobaltochelatase [Azotosporobacter soli]|uniref:sirohydrochlorin cobaltochelatase n=1 Tax=Azotosporobacter soli TaxID=3055040 RepID=UPI0031FEFAE3